ncbi:MAG TPA: NAD(P)-dependent oxidoreductase [Patescibacteria group bacterium]|nr:NAD(P)-dependent oxidoreductase [Patescibacteria group bacterium]
MKNKKHLVFVDREKWDREYLQRELKNYKLTFLSGLNQTDKIKDAEVLSVFINTRVTKEIIKKLPKLKFIATRSTGFDHIDLAACKDRGVKVAYVPTYGENTVAEHTFGLILCLSRKIYQAIERTRAGDFEIKNLMGFDLKGRTIGVVGCGNIGRHVVRMAHGFAMKVLVSDPCLTAKEAAKLKVSQVSLNVLMKKSDIITLHCPLNPATYQMINPQRLALVKPGSLLINTARGDLMDTTAVLDALEDGRLAGVGLDTLEEEGAIKHEDELLDCDFNVETLKVLLENHILIKNPNVVVTPHIAFNSREAVERILKTTVENIKYFLKGKPKNLVRLK